MSKNINTQWQIYIFDRNSIKNKDNITYMIPPALTEVRELVLQSVLKDLKHDAEHRAQPPVPQDQSL